IQLARLDATLDGLGEIRPTRHGTVAVPQRAVDATLRRELVDGLVGIALDDVRRSRGWTMILFCRICCWRSESVLSALCASTGKGKRTSAIARTSPRMNNPSSSTVSLDGEVVARVLHVARPPRKML